VLNLILKLLLKFIFNKKAIIVDWESIHHVAHDLKALLRAITTLIGFIKEDDGGNGFLQKKLKMIFY
jgi:hypothetical protein